MKMVRLAFSDQMSRRTVVRLAGVTMLGGLLAACGDDDDDNVDEPTPTLRAQSEDPTIAGEIEATATEASEVTATPTDEPDDDPTATAKSTSTPTSEPTATATATATAEPSATPEPTNTPEPTPEPTSTPEPEPTPTEVVEPTATPAPQPQTYTVEMNDQNVFVPAQLSINVGDTVVWVNVGTAPHTATCDPSQAINASSVNLPAGAAPWDTGILMGGESGSHTFDTPGEYTYFCIPHEVIGMIGHISVVG